MAIKPILFNTEMVRAILDGRKTCTRRLPRKQIEEKYLEYEEWVCAVAPPGSTWLREKEFYEEYPPYQLGDILYVRETWGHPIFLNSDKQYVFRADKIAESGFKNDSHIWHPSIHMPKEAARIWLKVTNVRVERLNEITDKGAEREGAQPDYPFDYDVDKWPNLEHFKKIWNSTIKKSDIDRYGWDANPWVWAIEFERCEKPEVVK